MLENLISKVDSVFYECSGSDPDPVVIALASGGMDSCVMLKYLSMKSRNVIVLTINPRSRSSMEVAALRKIVSVIGLSRLLVFNIPELYELIELKDLGIAIRNRDMFYIPGRNAIFLSIGIYVAEVYGAKVLFTAHNSEDVRFFPDASIDFMDSMTKVASYYIGEKDFRICPLFKNLSKNEVAALGKLINAPLEYSWSCYMGYSYQCGRCRGCVDRSKSLKFADKLILKNS